jgi:hypothetical protein
MKPPKFRPEIFVIFVIIIAALSVVILLTALGYLLDSYLFGSRFDSARQTNSARNCQLVLVEKESEELTALGIQLISLLLSVPTLPLPQALNMFRDFGSIQFDSEQPFPDSKYLPHFVWGMLFQNGTEYRLRGRPNLFFDILHLRVEHPRPLYEIPQYRFVHRLPSQPTG